MKKLILCLTLMVASLSMAGSAAAHHPGQQLDEVMGDKERYFQAIDGPAPKFLLANSVGEPVNLVDFADKIIVLHFVYMRCPDVCPLHAEKLAEIQTMLNQTPMKDMVQFITITTDPKNDRPDALEEYGAEHGLDPSNWIFLTAQAQQPEGTTRELAQAYGLEFTMTEDDLQMHGVVTHIIDKEGRLAAKFHGLRFEPINMVLYINGLINNVSSPTAPEESVWWDWLKGMFQ